ncbi:CopG family transcriptional regulator, partial [Aeromonas veronii]
LDERRGQAHFHKATFTLTHNVIEELNDMMQDDGLNKSHLVRLFTRYFATLSQEERQLIYERMGLKPG